MLKITMTVMVWGRPYDITVYKRSIFVWVAEGMYMDKAIQVESSGQGEAAKLWQQTARSKGNGPEGI